MWSPPGIATEDDDAFSFHEPQTMLLDDDDDDTADSSLVSDRTPGGTRTIKYKYKLIPLSSFIFKSQSTFF